MVPYEASLAMASFRVRFEGTSAAWLHMARSLARLLWHETKS